MKPHSGHWVHTVLFAAMACLLPASQLHAQAANQLRVERLQDLSFGTIVAGNHPAILPSAATAGKFRVQGLPNRTVLLSFSLPTHLTSGASSIPIAFGSASAFWSTVDNVATGTPFDPASGISLAIPPGRNVYVWIGARLGSAAMQPAGGYSGPVTLTAMLR